MRPMPSFKVSPY